MKTVAGHTTMTTPRVEERKAATPEWRIQWKSTCRTGLRSYAYDWRLYLPREDRAASAVEDKACWGGGCALAKKKTTLTKKMLAEVTAAVSALWFAGLCTFLDKLVCLQSLASIVPPSGHWHVVCTIKSNRKLDDQKLSQWPRTLQHQRYQRVPTHRSRPTSARTYLVRTLQGKLADCRVRSVCSWSKRHSNKQAGASP